MEVKSNSYMGDVNIGTTKKNDKSEFTKLVSEVSKDGVVTPEEREKIFNAGFKVKDKTKFEDLKQGISTDFPDIAAAFDEGFSAGKKSESLNSEVKQVVSSHLKSTLTKQAVANENYLRQTVGNLKEGVDIIKNGLKSSENNNDNSFLGSIKRKAAEIVGSGAESVSNTLNDLSLSDNVEKNIDSIVKSQSSEMSQSNVARFIGTKVGTVKKDYDVKASDLVNCVKHSLDTMGFARSTKISDSADDVSESSLEKMTNKKWDGFDFSKTSTSDAKDFLAGKEGKALVTDGGHAYVFKGLNKDGSLSVLDATINKMKTLSKDNTNLTVFVQGKADGDKTSTAKGDVKSFKDINSLSNINSVDKTNGKTNESWEIRKFLVLMGDQTESSSVKTIASAIKIDDVGKLKSELNKKGIKLDDREIKALSTVLNARIKDETGKTTTMIDKFVQLNAKSGVGQNNYMKAIEYTNLDLGDYFSSVTRPVDKAQSMNDVFKDIMKGKKGC